MAANSFARAAVLSISGPLLHAASLSGAQMGRLMVYHWPLVRLIVLAAGVVLALFITWLRRRFH